MNFAHKYIAKQNKLYFFEAPVLGESTQMVVIIPCYNEPDLIDTIQSLFHCEKPKEDVAIAVVINDSDQTDSAVIIQNQVTYSEIKELKKQAPSWLTLHAIYASKLPNKNAGAGWARKIGMDWAVSHFNRYNNKTGIIISLDADAQVEINYFKSISNYYIENQNIIGATIYFEHPIHNGENDEGIILYELYMRYYKNALEYIGYPNSIYSIGSCFTVRADAYVLQGGMNRKKAGEDFYFLQKLLPLGSIGQINNTKVIPSSRISNRVPFGTGPILKQYLDGGRELELTYPIDAFLILKTFFNKVDDYYSHTQFAFDDLSLDKNFKSYLHEINFNKELNELISNCSSPEIFQKRFFHLFNAFKILKWLNYGISNGFHKKNLLEESKKLLNNMNVKTLPLENDATKMLNLFRYLDKTT